MNQIFLHYLILINLNLIIFKGPVTVILDMSMFSFNLKYFHNFQYSSIKYAL